MSSSISGSDARAVRVSWRSMCNRSTRASGSTVLLTAASENESPTSQRAVVYTNLLNIIRPKVEKVESMGEDVYVEMWALVRAARALRRALRGRYAAGVAAAVAGTMPLLLTFNISRPPVMYHVLSDV